MSNLSRYYLSFSDTDQLFSATGCFDGLFVVFERFTDWKCDIWMWERRISRKVHKVFFFERQMLPDPHFLCFWRAVCCQARHHPYSEDNHTTMSKLFIPRNSMGIMTTRLDCSSASGPAKPKKTKSADSYESALDSTQQITRRVTSSW